MRGAVAAVAAAAALAGCGGEGLGQNAQLFVIDRGGGEPRRLTHDGKDYTPPVWSPRGDRLAASSETGIALFGADGRPVKDFRVAKMNAETPPAWSRSGRELAFETTYENPRTRSIDGRLVTLDVPSGKRRTLADFAVDTPSWSLRDRSLVYLTGDLAINRKPVRQQLWTVGADGVRAHRLARGANDDFPPQLSRDGRRLVFGRPHSVWVARADGSRQRRVANRIDLPVASWAPDDRDVLLVAGGETRDYAFVVTPDGRRRPLPRMIASIPVAWSPDARLIAWGDAHSGETLIHVVRPDGSGHRVLARMADSVFVAGLTWSPDGRRLAFSAHKDVD